MRLSHVSKLQIAREKSFSCREMMNEYSLSFSISSSNPAEADGERVERSLKTINSPYFSVKFCIAVLEMPFSGAAQ